MLYILLSEVRKAIELYSGVLTSPPGSLSACGKGELREKKPKPLSVDGEGLG